MRGKHKPTFTPHVDCGDCVIIINASEVNLTGNKLDDKIYYNHSGYTGGLRERTAREMKENYPVEMIERAVKGMLPKGRLGRQMYKNYLFMQEMNILIWHKSQWIWRTRRVLNGWKRIFLGTGRRKSSIAQVKMVPGKGKITVNGTDVRDFFHMKQM